MCNCILKQANGGKSSLGQSAICLTARRDSQISRAMLLMPEQRIELMWIQRILIIIVTCTSIFSAVTLFYVIKVLVNNGESYNN